MPKVQYPSFFDGGLVGVRAKEDIDHREAFLFVPFKLLLSLDYIHAHPVLGLIVK